MIIVAKASSLPVPSDTMKHDTYHGWVQLNECIPIIFGIWSRMKLADY